MEPRDTRITLPGYPLNAPPTCPKCGGISVRQRYIYSDDTVEHTCVCNYKWITLPLDDTIKPKKDGKHDRPAQKKRK